MKRKVISVFILLSTLLIFPSCSLWNNNPEISHVPQFIEVLPGFMLLPGSYTAGADFPAGEYVLISAGTDAGYFEAIFANDPYYTYNGDFFRKHFLLYEGDNISFWNAVLVCAENAPVRIDADAGYMAGMYKAGVDIPAGEYVIVDSSFGNNYFEITNAPLAQTYMPEFVGNGIFIYRQYVRLNAGQYVEFTAGKLYPLATAPQIIVNNDLSYSVGQYKIGDHIPEGNYIFTPEGTSVYFTTLNPVADLNFLAIGAVDIPVRMYLTAGQYITVRGGSLKFIGR